MTQLSGSRKVGDWNPHLLEASFWVGSFGKQHHVAGTREPRLVLGTLRRIRAAMSLRHFVVERTRAQGVESEVCSRSVLSLH